MEGDWERKDRPRCARSGAVDIRAARAHPAETRKHSAASAQAQRRAGSGAQKRHKIKNQEGGGVQKCGYSARAAAKIYVTARVPSRFTSGHGEPPRAS